MRILHVINNLESGGAESMLINFFKEISNTDNYCEILLLVNNDIAYKNIPPNIKIITLSNSKKRYSISKLYKLYKYIKNGKFDIVHSHLFPSQYYVSIVSMFLNSKIKFVTTEHSTTNTRRKFWLLKQLDKIIYKNYNNIIFISKGVEKQFNIDINNIKNGITLFNGIPLEQFKPINIKPKSNLLKIIMVARFSKMKDHITLLKAMLLLNDNYHLSLVGVGPLQTKVKEFVKEHKLKKRVHFLGFRNDIAKLYNEHDIFVLSSKWEGFGLVAVEAMASGLPVIASNVDGLKEVVNNAGLLFKYQNEKELANLIIKVSTDKILKNELVKKGLQKSKNYDIKNLVSKTLNLYNEIL